MFLRMKVRSATECPRHRPAAGTPATSAAAARRYGVALLGVVLLASGCASTGQHGPRPRTHDEKALLEEVRQSASPEPAYQLSLLYLAEHRVDDAVTSLQEALSRDPDYTPALTLLAQTLHRSGRVFEALDWFERRPLEEYPEPVQINIALLKAETGNTIEARSILESKRDGAWAGAARANLAYLDLLDEETVQARRHLEELIRDNIDSPEVLNNLAVARLRQGDVQGSVEILQRLTSRHEEFVPAHLNLALLLQYWLFDEEGAARSQAHLDTLVEPVLSEAVLQRLLDPTTVERTAPPVPAGPGASSSPEERP